MRTSKLSTKDGIVNPNLIRRALWGAYINEVFLILMVKYHQMYYLILSIKELKISFFLYKRIHGIDSNCAA